MAIRRRVGRPTKKATGKDLVALGLRVPPEIKRIVDAGAERSGRSQSQEAAFRIKRDALMEKGPGDLAQLLSILNLMQQVWGKSWRDDPDTRKALMGLCYAFFVRDAPEGFDYPSSPELIDFCPMLERIYQAIDTVKGSE